MKLYTAQVVAALALVVPFLICAADQQNKNHAAVSEGVADRDAYQDTTVDPPNKDVNMASDDDGDHDLPDDSDAVNVLASQLEKLADKNMDVDEESEDVNMESEQNGKCLLCFSLAILPSIGFMHVLTVRGYTNYLPITVTVNNFSCYMYILYFYHALIAGGGKSGAVIFKYVKEYDFIWNDRGSGADRDVSIWRPVDIEHGFSPLGDTASGRYGKPVIPAITVSAGFSNALAK